ncbi:HisA/HisF-related TIM barrel protein [Alphaproteobacteria bacterium]|nr:HisA/HisF-related TIM barrel protein [Alphaproteobacteria bacterium]
MNKNFRIIPSLLIENNKLIKTLNFKNPKYVGDPINVTKIFNDKNVDEIFIIDKSYSNKTHGPNLNLIQKMASECFVPVCYGGGIRNLKDAYKVFNLGIEKISIQQMVFKNFKNLNLLVSEFGSSSIVFSLDIIMKNNKYFVYDAFSEKIYSSDLKSVILRASESGAGEIFLNFIDLDGTLNGPDLEIFKYISNYNTSIIYQGGVSSIEDIIDLIKAGADSVAIGSFFIFYGKFKSVLISYPSVRELKEIMKSVQE